MRLSLADRILRYMELVPDPPCKGCSWHNFCRDERVGCLNFKAFTNHNYKKIPGGDAHQPWPPHGPKPALKIGVDIDI